MKDIAWTMVCVPLGEWEGGHLQHALHEPEQGVCLKDSPDRLCPGDVLPPQ